MSVLDYFSGVVERVKEFYSNGGFEINGNVLWGEEPVYVPLTDRTPAFRNVLEIIASARDE